MHRQPIPSSNLKSVGYDPTHHVLEVEFQSGSIYQYHEVPATVHEALLRARSHGRYFVANIRDRYPYRRVWSVRYRR